MIESLSNPEAVFEEFRQKLIWFRNDWDDKIPDRIVDGSDKEYFFSKVRKNWFTGVVGYLEFFSRNDYLKDKSLQNKVDEFVNYYSREEFSKRLTKESDIKLANEVLDLVIDKLAEIS